MNARGAISTALYQYGTDGVTYPYSKTVLSSPFSGFLTGTANANLTGLTPGATYYCRLRATSAQGVSTSGVMTFTTLAPPTVQASGATSIGPTGAVLNGFVNGHGQTTTVFMEYGTDGVNFPNNVVPTPSSTNGSGNALVTATVSVLAPGQTYFYRLVGSSSVGTVVSAPSSFATLAVPVATVGGSFALTTTSARVGGSVRARNSAATVTFEYGTNGVTFSNSVAASPAVVTGDVETAVTADIINLLQSVTYYYRVKAVSAGGTGTSTSAALNIAVLSGFAQQFPAGVLPADRQGLLIVNLIPSGLPGEGWRFVGEQQWRASGAPATGLTTSDREIEFRPVPGYYQPARELVSVVSGGLATLLDREYYESDDPGGSGAMTIVIKPDAVTMPTLPVAQRAQWRLLGEDDTQWRESGATLSGLRPGSYLVECKPLAGRTTPPAISVAVQDAQTRVATATYFLADAPVGTPPVVLPFETVTNSSALPYGYVGQIRSDVGLASGFVVKPRVVATAAHVVFDDGALAYATGLQWLFQRDSGTYEPKPQTPRGFYVFSGYSAQRAAENSPGTATPASQSLDAAAMYFLEDAGRGGFAGYLASDSDNNEWLLSAGQKTLVGYPVDGIAASDQGRMHATPLANIPFAHPIGTGHIFTTTAIRSAGGNSGGPLFVQFAGGAYYPAAIYLGGSAQTVVRAIDSGMIDLFARAEVSSIGGADNTGGGIIQVNTPVSGATFAAAALKVDVSPVSAVSAGAQWRLGANGTARGAGVQLNNLSPGNYTLYFNPVAGFLTPPPAPVTLLAGSLRSVTRKYYGVVTQPVNQTVNAFNTATFTVEASAKSESPTYQWKRNGVNVTGGTSSVDPTTGVASYTLPNVTVSDTANYSVVVTWPEFDGVTHYFVSQSSNSATLTVTPLSQTITFSTLSDRILGDPPLVLNATVSSGLPVAFVLVSGPATLNGSILTPTGFGTVTVKAKQTGDGNYAAAAQVTRTFQVTGDNLDSWRARVFTASELSNPQLSGPLADLDRDGLNTLLEFALNLNPKLNDRATMIPGTGTSGLPLIQIENIGGQSKLTAEFVRRRAAGVPGVSYAMEFTNDLTNAASWSAAGNTETVTQIDETWERVKVTGPQPATPSRYGRLKVTLP